MRTLTAIGSLGAALAASLLLTPTSALASPDPSCVPVSSADLAAFFDRAVPERLAADHVPGMVVSVVADGATTFARGYGQADIEGGIPMDPDRSLVRIASITKLFTWTAVMQQVEAGRLDLDADVNQYLTEFQIPATFPEPVTLRTLMNHTAGFEDHVIGTGARTAADVLPLGEYLEEDMPARIRPPGHVSGYSNYGAALAGYIVAEVSGEPYDQYIRTHVFDKLGMTHSTAAEPVRAWLAHDLATSYNSETSTAVPFTFDVMVPDGAISATASDMARFMAAHLDEDGGGILPQQTMDRMHERTFAADPRLGGYAHGFMDRTMNGHRVLMHDGSWEGFLSALILLPDCDLGLFVSANATGGIDAISEIIPAFFDRFAPETGETAQHSSGPASPLSVTEPRAGFYKPTRHNESDLEKLVTLLGPARLQVTDDDTVRFQGKDYSPQSDGLFASADGNENLVFLAGPDEEVYAATDGQTFQLMPTSETLPVNIGVGAFIAVTALSALAVPLSRLRKRERPVPTWRLARALTASALALALAFLIMLIARLLGDTGDFLYGVPTDFALILSIPIIVMTIAAAGLILTLKGWRTTTVTLAARIHQVTMIIALSTFVAFCWQWNLIGWQYA